MQTENSIDAAHERAAFQLRVEAAADPVLVMCDAETCGAREFANLGVLRRAGWFISRAGGGVAFCPEHNTPE